MSVNLCVLLCKMKSFYLTYLPEEVKITWGFLDLCVHLKGFRKH